LEGINVNEGRGTDKPFLQFGAPWINAEELQELMAQKNIPWIKTQTCSYIPDDSLYKGEKCFGLKLDIIQDEKLHPVDLGLTIITSLINLYPQRINQRAYVTNVNPTGVGHLDRLLGVKNSFDLLSSGLTFQTDVSETWPAEMTPYLLYN